MAGEGWRSVRATVPNDEMGWSDAGALQQPSWLRSVRKQARSSAPSFLLLQGGPLTICTCEWLRMVFPSQALKSFFVPRPAEVSVVSRSVCDRLH